MADARTRMIDAAERLATERGLGAMSLRAVQAASGQRNKSAAQYHFGSRDGLVEAVIAARMGPVNERRVELLAGLGAEPSVREVVEVLVHPLAEATIGRPGSRWAQFLLQGWADPAVQAVVGESFDAGSYRAVRELLDGALASLPPTVRTRRINQAVGLVVLTLAGAERTGTARRPLSPAQQIADLVDACVGLLTAPSSITAPAQEDPC